MLSSLTIKVDGSDFRFVNTCVNFSNKKVYEDEFFGRQDILQFLSGESKYLKY